MAEEKIEIEPLLESVLRCCLDDAKKRMLEGKTVVPFTALSDGKSLLMEEHSADDASTSFAEARKTVAKAKDAQAYGFCYDGFVEVENKIKGGLVQRDCLIAEGGLPGAEYGHAIGFMYSVDDEGKVSFHNEPIYVGKALNYMATIGLEGIDDVEVFTGAAQPSKDEG